MILPSPFVYSPHPHERKHGPAGYKTYKKYKPWLRDEFTFRCVYCLERELWYPDRADSFSGDHVIPQKEAPDRVGDYTNLVYACTRCNSFKLGVRLLDPTTVAFGEHLVLVDGYLIKALTREGQILIRQLHLNEDPALSVRRFRLEILALFEDYPNDPRVEQLFKDSFAFPDDLPDLVTLKPPGGNTRDENKYSCFHARREKGELDPFY